MKHTHLLIILITFLFSPIFSEEKQEAEEFEKSIENEIKFNLGNEFDKVHEVSNDESVLIGVFLSDMDFEDAYKRHYKECFGVRVSGLVDGGNAEIDGILEEDIIMEFGGVQVKFENHLLNLKKDFSTGDKVNVKLFRDGEIKEIELTFRAKEEDVDIEFSELKLSAGFGGGGPVVFLPEFNYNGINNYIAQFGFDSIPMEAGTHFGGYGMVTIGNGWFIGGMGGGMTYSQSFTDTSGFRKNVNLESGLGGLLIAKKVPLFTEKLILDFSSMIGGGETLLTLSQSTGDFSWDNDEISNGKNWGTTYKKSFFALYPQVGLLVRIQSWLGIRASVGNMFALSTNNKWTVDNFTLNSIGGDSPKVPNGMTYSIGIHFGN